MSCRLTQLEMTMESMDRLVAWATELKRQPITTDGLTTHQAGVLHLCVRQGPVGLDQLGRLLGSAPSTITALIDRLEARHMVRRIKDPGDGRRFIIEPTEEGRSHYEEIESRSRGFIETLFAEWSVTDVDTLRRLVDRFLGDATGLRFTDAGEPPLAEPPASVAGRETAKNNRVGG